MAANKPAANSAVGARKLARERMAAAMEARRQREEENTKDLEAFYLQVGKVDAAAAKRDAAIAAAHAAYAEAETAALDEQGEALRSIRDRNTPQAELVDMTGLSTGELQKLLKRSAPVKPPASEAKVKPASKAADKSPSTAAKDAAGNVTSIGSRAAAASVPAGDASADPAEREALGAAAESPVSAT